MASNLTSTTRLRSRDYANKIRHGSPKLQETLREKCRQKMREKRNQLFNRRRLGVELDSKDIQDTLTELVREEIKNLTTSDWNDENISEANESLTEEQALELENQIIQEQEQWMLQEYDRISQEEIEYLTAYLKDNNDAICPICQKAVLLEKNNCLTCSTCGLMLTGCTKQEVKYLINESLDKHAMQCFKTPTFTAIPENNSTSLFMMCCDCSTLKLVL